MHAYYLTAEIFKIYMSLAWTRGFSFFVLMDDILIRLSYYLFS